MFNTSNPANRTDCESCYNKANPADAECFETMSPTDIKIIANKFVPLNYFLNAWLNSRID